MSKLYGSYFKWGVSDTADALPEQLNSCFVMLDWAKIMPEKDAEPNYEVLKEYKTLLENYMLEQKRPIVILSDGTLPSYLQEEGGWENRATTDAYVAYAELCFDTLTECVEQWVTFEELLAEFFVLSRNSGKFVVPKKSELQCLHHMLVAHGMAVKLFRANGYFGKIGVGLSLANFIPATPSKQDKRACKTFDLLCNQWIPSMLDHGIYPYFSSLFVFSLKDRPRYRKDDPEIVAQVIDFVLISFHSGIMVSEQKTDEVIRYRHSAIIDEQSSMYALVRKMYRKTRLPMFIWDKHTIHTKDDIAYSKDVFTQLERLLLSWVDVRGYFVPCKDLSTPSVHLQSLIKYIEKQ